ncbi:IctB family putative bicarbonate transporter [Spirulina sp. CS-785/01]|uniref:IctB family putative bicarbonate transporter n=1 Tax=Spirulina sp. CS-785/01 TaxID=3021716 RepID=UPI00232B6A48|nr:IctB family putative bicarbonate transporter [Spirulina sp. CS-785/01]MDB9313193.1 IctB family putative bicarbonate transporter [Spirulina sp. CS-785/01]
MNETWQRIALRDLSLSRWRGGSYLYRLVGFLGRWRTGSWLLQWAEPLGALLLSLVFLLAPFVSTSLIGVLLLACGGYWGLLTLTDGEKGGATPIHLLVGVYWGISVIATAFSPAQGAAIDGLVKVTLYLFLFVLAAHILRSPRWRNVVVTVYLHIALIVGGYGIRQEFKGVEQLATWNDPSSELAQDTRVYSYLGNPNLLAGYLITAVALSASAMFIWRKWWPKLLAMTMFLVNLACLFYTDSRGGWLGASGLLLVFLLLLRYWFAEALPKFWRVWLVPMVFGGFAALVVSALVVVEPLRLRVLSIFAWRGDSSNNYRINVWEAVFQMIGDYPWVGIGPGNSAFTEVYPRYARAGYDNALSSYSIFLEHLVEIGVIGFGVFLWLIMVTVDGGLRGLAKLRDAGDEQGFWLMGAIAALAGLMVHGLFDTVWYRPQVNTLWWLMVALIASFYPQHQQLKAK